MTANTTDTRSIQVDSTQQPGVLVVTYHGANHANLPGGSEIDLLCEAFEAIQHGWEAVVTAGELGRIVAVAPAAAALGEPALLADAAVTGGLISLVRSLAIELAKSGGTANTLLYDPARPSATRAMLHALTSPDGSDVTGQEIYVAGSLSTGRLHP